MRQWLRLFAFGYKGPSHGQLILKVFSGIRRLEEETWAEESCRCRSSLNNHLALVRSCHYQGEEQEEAKGEQHRSQRE